MANESIPGLLIGVEEVLGAVKVPPHPFPTAVLMKQGLEGIAAADVSPENQEEEKKSNQWRWSMV